MKVTMSGSIDCRVARSVMLSVLCVASATAGAGWTAVDTGGCTLETGETRLFDGYQDTRIKLSLGEDGLRVQTGSNIDPGFNDLGLAVDSETFIAADSVVDEQDVLFSKDGENLIEQFVRGRSVKVYIRFWPTYPATKRYQTSFSLLGFTKAYHDYRKCRDKSPA